MLTAIAANRACPRCGQSLVAWFMMLRICFTVTAAELSYSALTLHPRFSGAADLKDKLQAGTSNPYLPDGCLTYDERYLQYRDDFFFANRSQAWAPNLEQPQANKAVIIRIHAQIQFTPDLILAFRALMVETQQYGYHTLFLTTAFSWDSHERLTRADLISKIPTEFRQNLVLYDAADIRAHYPAHGISEVYSGYLPVTWLMHKYRAYEFIYILESDVRLVGHWGSFLDAALAFSAHVPERFLFDDAATDSVSGETPMMTEEERAKFRHGVISLGNDNTSGQVADLLVFNGVERFWKYDEEEFGKGGRHHPFLNIGEKYHAWVMVQGWSRKLMQQLHQWSLAGQGAYDEIAPPTIAVHGGDKVVSVKMPQYETTSGRTYDRCCLQGGEKMYEEFHKDRAACKPYVMLHPIKNHGDNWVKATEWQDSSLSR